MLPVLEFLIVFVVVAVALLIGLLVFQYTPYMRDAMLVLSLCLSGIAISAGIKIGMGLNLLWGLLLSTTLTCGAVAFIWGMNRYSYRHPVIQFFAGLLLWLFSWISALVIAVCNVVGLGGPVEILEERIWKMPHWLDNTPGQLDIQNWAEGVGGAEGVGDDIVDVVGSAVRRAIAAIPDPDERTRVEGKYRDFGSIGAIPALLRLGLGHLLPSTLQRRRRGAEEAQQPLLVPEQENDLNDGNLNQ